MESGKRILKMSHNILAALSDMPDEDVNLAESALALVSFMHEGVSLDRYKNHFQQIQKDTKERYDALVGQGAKDDAGTRLAALKYVITEVNGYQSANPQTDVIDRYDIMRVVDLGSGSRAILALFYINAARSIRWRADVLDFPGGLLCRIEHEGERLIFDPAAGCQLMAAHDLRQRVKEVNGEQAELSSNYYNAMPATDILVSIHNNIKLRFIEMGDYEAALEMVTRLKTIKPEEYRLYLDAGVLHARLGQIEEAVNALNFYIKKTPSFADKAEAMELLADLDV
ncbi:MAG: tetratricopeptide repeat protein [Alphaproteobacteria bacterium]|nr:tetratricopeptide repeat protein [Alphaproteobacteria bacterium]